MAKPKKDKKKPDVETIQNGHCFVGNLYLFPFKRKVLLGRVVLHEYTGERRKVDGKEVLQKWVVVVKEGYKAANIDFALEVAEADINADISVAFGNKMDAWINVQDIPKEILVLDAQVDVFDEIDEQPKEVISVGPLPEKTKKQTARIPKATPKKGKK